MKPRVGDYVAGHLDFGIQYFGVVLETNYSAESLMPGAYVSGKKVFSNMWKGQIEEDDPSFFVPLSRLRII